MIWRLRVLSLLCAALVVGCASDETSRDPIVVHNLEVYSVDSYDRLAATATLVVEAKTVSIERAGTMGPAGSELGMNEATLRIRRSYKGGADGQVRLLYQGYDVASGREVIVDGAVPIREGEIAIWFLASTDVGDGAYHQLSSAGRVVRGPDGLAVTAGSHPPAAAACGAAWASVQRAVSQAVENSASTAPLRPLEKPPGYTGDKANECSERNSHQPQESEK